MAGIKLAKLPERTPIKLVINIMPELSEALERYAAVYEASYGRRESVSDLVPYMLSTFLEGDRVFARAQTSPPTN